MTVDEVRMFVRAQSAESMSVTNAHRIKLEQSIISPQKISLICRAVVDGRVQDSTSSVWLVGQEALSGGYKIVMQDDGKQFGLASTGFIHDKYLVLDGWYGTLLSAFQAM